MMSSKNRPSVDELIAHWNLELMGAENVLFTQSYLSDQQDENGNPQYTAIVALITNHPDSYSDMHRLVNDELWHFYLGDAIELLLLRPDGSSELVILGQDIRVGERFQYLVPAGVWMGARLKSGGEYAVFGNTMSPGFMEKDFEIGKAKELKATWPQQADMIDGLTRQ
jgi:predicted cupin superfamily sugar epimerase